MAVFHNYHDHVIQRSCSESVQCLIGGAFLGLRCNVHKVKFATDVDMCSWHGQCPCTCPLTDALRYDATSTTFRGTLNVKSIPCGLSCRSLDSESFTECALRPDRASILFCTTSNISCQDHKHSLLYDLGIRWPALHLNHILGMWLWRTIFSLSLPVELVVLSCNPGVQSSVFSSTVKDPKAAAEGFKLCPSCQSLQRGTWPVFRILADIICGLVWVSFITFLILQAGPKLQSYLTCNQFCLRLTFLSAHRSTP